MTFLLGPLFGRPHPAPCRSAGGPKQSGRPRPCVADPASPALGCPSTVLPAGWTHWGDFGSQGALFGVTLASLWQLSWNAAEHPWGTVALGINSGINSGIILELSRYILGVCDACAYKMASRLSELSRNYLGICMELAWNYRGKVAQEPQLPTPLHSRRGLG